MEITKTQLAKQMYDRLKSEGLIEPIWFTGLIDNSVMPEYTGRAIWVSRHNKAYYLDEMGAQHLDNIIQLFRRNNEREPYVVKIAWEKRLELEHLWRTARQIDERLLEGVAMNIVHQLGDALYEALPPQIAHDHFVTARQATNDKAIDFTKRLIKQYTTEREA